MKRVIFPERSGLRETAQEHGYTYDSVNGIPSWEETACYLFTLEQIERDLEAPAEEIERLCFELLERAMRNEKVFKQLGIPEAYWDYVAESWQRQDKHLYGRMDFSYDGQGDAKLLEYNADTPTTLYEAAIFQWVWLQQNIVAGELPDTADQFAEIHEGLVAAFAQMGVDDVLHLACLTEIEDDRETTIYIEECAQEAGLETNFLGMRDIGIDAEGHFTDLDDRVITSLFKLYPWEWLMDETFGASMAASSAQFIEPPWKTVLSNKGLLPLLWEMFEGHPNLLPAFFDHDVQGKTLSTDYVRKPLLSRRGENISRIPKNTTIAPAGVDGTQPRYIFQEYHPLPVFAGRHPVVGCWLVAGQAVGIGIREDRSWITGENAYFVPHAIVD